ncbi:DUF805 domain-containing protein [Asticcacaulis sp. AC402]|uniref:DUF805 domain-containing protein n=1 Tax=Asticcacaulis sp. AC402 TaxID=1282361 RepID=UPI0003C3E0EC|nr:DUF805 domain-containing protein [Asticcacaulis sp. AC402]ESQ76810.1 hypothetical protein ABAC402_03880 [Asticcacaulis sp. AC402]
MRLMFEPLRKYFDFQGRARRAEYWQFWLANFILFFVLDIMSMAASGGGKSMIGILKILLVLGLAIPNLAVAVRRLHDTNRTGWWIILPTATLLITLMMFIGVQGAAYIQMLEGVSQSSDYEWRSQLAEAGAFLGTLFLWVILPTCVASLVIFIFHVLPGTEGPNRFGDDPKGGAADIARVFDAPEETDARAAHAEPHKPVFDFGPARGVPSVREAAPSPASQPRYPPAPTGNPLAPGAIRPTFGKRR